MAPTFSSGFIEKKVKDKTFSTKDLDEAFNDTKRKFISPAWKKFLAVYDENGEIIKSYVVCKCCSKAMSSNLDTTESKKGSGTSNLLRHSKECTPKEKRGTSEGNSIIFFEVFRYFQEFLEHIFTCFHFR